MADFETKEPIKYEFELHEFVIMKIEGVLCLLKRGTAGGFGCYTFLTKDKPMKLEIKRRRRDHTGRHVTEFMCLLANKKWLVTHGGNIYTIYGEINGEAKGFTIGNVVHKGQFKVNKGETKLAGKYGRIITFKQSNHGNQEKINS